MEPSALSLEKLKEAYRQIETPVLLVDRRLQILYANPAAVEACPVLAAPEGLEALLPADILERLAAELPGGASYQSSRVYTFSMTKIKVTSLSCSDAPAAALVQLAPLPVAEDPLHPQGSLRFLNAFNYQFRAPLFAVFSALDSFSIAEDLPARQRQLLESIRKSCYHLLRGCSQFTEYQKSLCQVSDDQLEVVNLTDSIRQLADALNLMLAGRSQRLEASLPDHGVFCCCDWDRVVTVLANLVSNASRFSDPGGGIFLSMEDQGSMAVIRVRDVGCGIPQSVLPKVFQPYFSFEQHQATSEHLGLGLTICKHIVARMGGTIEIESSPRGTTVSFTLPAAGGAGESSGLAVPSVRYLRDSFSQANVIMSDID